MFNEIAKNFPNIQFTWIGDGELRNELTSENIKITGWLERQDVLKELNKNDIFILPSLWEGLPISLLEAMYMKKICIVSDVIGNRDVIKDGINGFVCNVLADYIKHIKNIQNTHKINDIIQNECSDIKHKYNDKYMFKQYKKGYVI